MAAKKITQEEAQVAWDTIAKFLTQHENFTFFISPWDSKDHQRYTLQDFHENKLRSLIVSKTKWKN